MSSEKSFIFENNATLKKGREKKSKQNCTSVNELYVSSQENEQEFFKQQFQSLTQIEDEQINQRVQVDSFSTIDTCDYEMDAMHCFFKDANEEIFNCLKQENGGQLFYERYFAMLNKDLKFNAKESFKINQQAIFDALRQKGYYLGKYLTSGGQGSIFSGYQLEIISGGVFPKEVVFKIYFDSELDEIKKEIGMMKVFEKKTNLITLQDDIISENFMILVIEKCKYSLQDELNEIADNQLIFTSTKLFQIVFDLLDGLVQLRVYNIIHCDIKPGNILVRESGYYAYTDFGCSLTKTECQEQGCFRGFTRRYAPDEIKKGSLQNIDFKSDVYSLGILLKEIIQAYQKGQHDNELEKEVENFKEIINKYMVQDKIYDRKDCQDIQDLFFKEIIYFCSKNKKLLEYYFKKLSEMIELTPYDNKKDIQYYQQLKFHYLKQQLEIAKAILSTNEEIQIMDKMCLLHLELSHKPQALEISLESLRLKRLQTDNSLSKTSLANSLFLVGRCYKDVGQNKEALQFSLESVQLAKQQCSGNHIDTARFLDGTAIIYCLLGNYQESLKFAKEALGQFQSLFQGENFEVARCLNSLGNRYSDIQDIEMAKKYSLESLEMREELFKGDHPDVAQSLYNVCNRLNELCQYKEALQYSERAYKMVQQIYKEDHQQTALSLDQLGITYKHLANFQKSLEYQKLSLEMRERLNKTDHYDTSQSLHNVGTRYFDLGDFENALKYAQRALQMRQKLFVSQKHPQLVKQMILFAEIYSKIDFVEAIKYSKIALDMAQQVFIDNHIYKYEALECIGNNYCEFITKLEIDFANLSQAQILMHRIMDQDQIQDQENNSLKLNIQQIDYAKDFRTMLRYFNDSHEMIQSLYKGNHLNLAKSLNNLGVYYRNLNDLNHAQEYLFDSLKMKNGILTGDHPEIARSLDNIGIYNSKVNDLKNAKDYINQSIKMKKHMYDQTHPSIAESLYEYGILLLKEGKFTETLKIFQECLEMRERVVTQNTTNNYIPNIQFQIGVCFFHLAKNEQSLEYLKKYLDSVNSVNLLERYNKIKQLLANQNI